MKRKLFMIIAVLIFCVALFGCSVSNVPTESDYNTKNPMFVCVEQTEDWMIVYHKDTKVLYAVSDRRYNRGNFTLLVNPDGSPMIYESEVE